MLLFSFVCLSCCTVLELFGVSHVTHGHPLRTLRVHIHRLSALQLWSVAKYAAGRGADRQQLKRLGMAAWLSDGNSASANSSGQVSMELFLFFWGGGQSQSPEGWGVLAAAQLLGHGGLAERRQFTQRKQFGTGKFLQRCACV